MKNPATNTQLDKRVRKLKTPAEQNTAASPLESLKHSAPPLISSVPPRDELLLIDGVDPLIEMALNSIGIRKFTDFRNYTPETLAQALQERAGLAITAATIVEQDWIAWAELHAAETEREKTAEQQPASVGGYDEKSQAAPSAAAGTILPQSQKPAATDETDQDEPHGEVILSIQRARFHQFERPAAANAVAAKFLRGEIDCGVAGAAVAGTATELCTQVFAIDTATDEHKLLAVQWQRLQASQSDYRFEVEFAAPPLGRYQLQIVALLLEDNPKIAFSQGPILRVIS